MGVFEKGVYPRIAVLKGNMMMDQGIYIRVPFTLFSDNPKWGIQSAHGATKLAIVGLGLQPDMMYYMRYEMI